MPYGERFNGMTNEMILVEIATRLKVIEDKVDKISCPSPRCQEHDHRISIIETTEKNKNDSGAALIAWVGVFTAIIAVGVSILALWGT